MVWEATVHPSSPLEVATGRITRHIGAAPRIATEPRPIGLAERLGATRCPGVRPVPASNSPGKAGTWRAIAEQVAAWETGPVVEA